jgi:excisionase family DNA binding protein
MNEATEPVVLTLDEVAELLRVHPSTMYRLLKRNEIPAFRIGSDYRFNRRDIDEWRFNRANGKQ